MKRHRPASVGPDEVRITRTDDTAIIEHADEAVWTRNLTLGPRIAEMTDAEILAEHNACLAAEAEGIDNYENVCVEMPPGRPQVLWDAKCHQWVPQGDIVRCVIGDGAVDENGDRNVTIQIDDHELSLAEFGRMLMVHAGWGMRIAFVPEAYLHDEPEVEVREQTKP